MEPAVALGHLATALAIGLLLGVEREHDNAHDSNRPAGSATTAVMARKYRTVGAAAFPGVARLAYQARGSGERRARGEQADVGEGGAVVGRDSGAVPRDHPCGAALATNTVVKLVLVTVAGGPRFALRLAAWLAPVVVAVGLGMAW